MVTRYQPTLVHAEEKGTETVRLLASKQAGEREREIASACRACRDVRSDNRGETSMRSISERERGLLTINKSLKIGNYDALSDMSHVRTRILCRVRVMWGAITGFIYSGLAGLGGVRKEERGRARGGLCMNFFVCRVFCQCHFFLSWAASPE